MRDRARYLERFGIPFILAKIRRDDFDDSSVRGSILNSLSKVGSDGVGVVTEGSDLQVIDGSSNSADDFQGWMEYIDRLCALLVLGQTATSGDASGLSRGQAQENVRRDIIEADCKNLMETIDSQILHPLEEYRYGTSGTLRFSLDYSSPESLSEKAQIVKSLADAGYRASPDWVQKTFGIQLAQAEQ
jgi:phage gp29-like protein